MQNAKLQILIGFVGGRFGSEVGVEHRDFSVEFRQLFLLSSGSEVDSADVFVHVGELIGERWAQGRGVPGSPLERSSRHV